MKALMLILALCAIACSVDRPSVDVSDNGGLAMSAMDRRLYPAIVVHFIPNAGTPQQLGAQRYAGLAVSIDHTNINACKLQDITSGASVEPFTIPWEWVLEGTAYFQENFQPIPRPE